MRDEKLEIDGLPIHCQVSRGEGRTILFVHGNSSSGRTWTKQLVGALGDQFRCVAIDLPGHGDSSRFDSSSDYSLPRYASVVKAVANSFGSESAVVVGWSLGGHIALEAAPLLPEAAGFLIFGTPPVGRPPAMESAFLPNPAMAIGLTAEVSKEDARAYATSFLAPTSGLPLDDFIADIMRTDGAARSGVAAGIMSGDYTDELEIVRNLAQPLAIFHGRHEQLVNLDYLLGVDAPTLWRGQVAVIEDAGHAPHQENSESFNGLLTNFLSEI